MKPTRYTPTEAEEKAAKRRVVPLDNAENVVRGIFSATLEGVRQAAETNLANGGCVRAVPVNQDGVITTQGGSGSGIDDFFQQIQYLALTLELQGAADAMCAKNLDWKETERLNEIP